MTAFWIDAPPQDDWPKRTIDTFDGLRERDRASALARLRGEAEFDESQHPRDESGKFTDGGGEHIAAGGAEHGPDLVIDEGKYGIADGRVSVARVYAVLEQAFPNASVSLPLGGIEGDPNETAAVADAVVSIGAAEAASRFAEQYPNVAADVRDFQVDADLRSGVLGQTTVIGSGKLGVRIDDGMSDRLNDMLERNALYPYDTTATSFAGEHELGLRAAYATTMHELGHVIDYHASAVATGHAPDHYEVENGAGFGAAGAPDDAKRDLSDATVGISRYAQSKPEEAVAEAFAADQIGLPLLGDTPERIRPILDWLDTQADEPLPERALAASSTGGFTIEDEFPDDSVVFRYAIPEAFATPESQLASSIIAALEFDESQHPRGPDGKFTSGDNTPVDEHGIPLNASYRVTQFMLAGGSREMAEGYDKRMTAAEERIEAAFPNAGAYLYATSSALAEELASRAEAFAAKFPATAAWITNVSSSTTVDESIFACVQRGQSIVLNERWYKDEFGFARAVEDSARADGHVAPYDQPFHPLGTTASVIDHEFGHVLDAHQGHLSGDTEWSSFGDRLGQISRYAATSPSEAFAEQFAYSLNNPGIDRPEVDNDIERYMREIVDGSRDLPISERLAASSAGDLGTCSGYVPQSVIDEVNAHARDAQLASSIATLEFNEDDHPRDEHGRFSSNGNVQPGETPEFPASHVAPVAFLEQGKAGYITRAGLPEPAPKDFQAIVANPERGTRIAHDYEDLPLDDPEAHDEYDALATEVHDQFVYLTHDLGVTVEVLDHDPYDNVEQLRADLEANHHLGVLATVTTGPHPYLTDQQNDEFRAVHDAFGHAAIGRGFDRNGEEAAFQSHAQMFTPPAMMAMATETRGQNSSLIYGGTGTFPPQKVAILPAKDLELARRRGMATQAEADADNLYDVTGCHHTSLGRTLARPSTRLALGIIGALADFDEGEHPRDDHGRFTSGGGLDDVDVAGQTSWASLPLSQRKAIMAHAEKLGWPDRDGIRRNFVDLYRQAATTDTFPYTGRHTMALAEGTGWYGRAHDQIEDARASLRGPDGDQLDQEQFLGMVTAIAGNSAWEAGGKTTDPSFPNLEMSERIARVLGADPEVTLTDADAAYWRGEQGNLFSYDAYKDDRTDPDAPAGFAAKQTRDLSEFVGTHRLSELPSDVVARIGNSWMATGLFVGSGSTTGWPNITKAVDVWRGQPVEEAIGGNKLRAFYNGLAFSGAAEEDAVIDRWMGRAGTGSEKFKNGMLDTPGGYIDNPDWVKNAGSYPLFADAVVKGAAQVGAEVSDFQAVVWYTVQAQKGR